MTNEEVLTAFGEYLESRPDWPNSIRTIAEAQTTLLQFAAAIDPTPLAETTLQEIRTFVRDHKAPAVPMRPLPLSQREVETRYAGMHSELRYKQIQLVMLYFCRFRKSIKAPK